MAIGLQTTVMKETQSLHISLVKGSTSIDTVIRAEEQAGLYREAMHHHFPPMLTSWRNCAPPLTASRRARIPSFQSPEDRRCRCCVPPPAGRDGLGGSSTLTPTRDNVCITQDGSKCQQACCTKSR